MSEDEWHLLSSISCLDVRRSGKEERASPVLERLLHMRDISGRPPWQQEGEQSGMGVEASTGD